uniref:Putative secreted protein n=1 Tax=Anopheles darlingi TaxID=43151 RepID=A0A2M4DKG9_ANODA
MLSRIVCLFFLEGAMNGKRVVVVRILSGIRQETRKLGSWTDWEAYWSPSPPVHDCDSKAQAHIIALGRKKVN